MTDGGPLDLAFLSLRIIGPCPIATIIGFAPSVSGMIIGRALHWTITQRSHPTDVIDCVESFPGKTGLRITKIIPCISRHARWTGTRGVAKVFVHWRGSPLPRTVIRFAPKIIDIEAAVAKLTVPAIHPFPPRT